MHRQKILVFSRMVSIRIGVILELGIEGIYLEFMIGRVGFQRYALYVTKAEGGDNA